MQIVARNSTYLHQQIPTTNPVLSNNWYGTFPKYLIVNHIQHLTPTLILLQIDILSICECLIANTRHIPKISLRMKFQLSHSPIVSSRTPSQNTISTIPIPQKREVKYLRLRHMSTNCTSVPLAFLPHRDYKTQTESALPLFSLPMIFIKKEKTHSTHSPHTYHNPPSDTP